MVFAEKLFCRILSQTVGGELSGNWKIEKLDKITGNFKTLS